MRNLVYGVFPAAVFCITLMFAMPASADRLTWQTDPENVTGYRVYFGSDADLPDNVKDIGFTGVFDLGHLNLPENVPCFFRVAAYNSAGESDLSNTVSWTPADTTPPAPPVGLDITFQQ